MSNWDRALNTAPNLPSRSSADSAGLLPRPCTPSPLGDPLLAGFRDWERGRAGAPAGTPGNAPPSFANALLGMSEAAFPAWGEPWSFVRSRFDALEAALRPNQNHMDDAARKIGGIARSLNKCFYGTAHDGNTWLVGSWGKGTVISPANDADVVYLLPPDLFDQYEAYDSNGQSALLQRVKGPLADRHVRTKIKGDRQVVVLEFNSLMVEVVPGFAAEGGGIVICDAAAGGSWKVADPSAERQRIEDADRNLNGLLKPTIMMLKQWKRTCSVPIKSFMLERLAEEALSTMPVSWLQHRWFDWIIRGAFLYMCSRARGVFLMAGRDSEIIRLGSEWRFKAESAHRRADLACRNEHDGANRAAGEEWQKIFGTAIPRLAM